MAECAKVAASLQQKVKVLSPTSDADDAILAGVGFGPAFYKQVSHSAHLSFLHDASLNMGIQLSWFNGLCVLTS